MKPAIKHTIAALLGLWLVLAGWMPALVGGSTRAGAFDVQSCCGRKASSVPCCGASCCVAAASADCEAMPGVPAGPLVNPLPEWVPLLVEFLQLPDPASGWVFPTVSIDAGASSVSVPLFLRDRVFLI